MKILSGDVEGGLPDLLRSVELAAESSSLTDKGLSLANMAKFWTAGMLTTFQFASTSTKWNLDEHCSEEQYLACVEFYQVTFHFLS